ncbi:uncharacterized protein [Rutidosis leptorrhynchoides]|uniref:uncharacterized protein n=1 Tax=Rutidosis leptorrhynchoides TaxID=125765 RepID=UPI003A999242
MMKWGRKKTYQTTSSTSLMSNVFLKKWTLRIKKKKDGVEPESRNSRFDKWYENEDNNSDYRLNVSPVSTRSFKKMVGNERSMREFISEEERHERIRRKALNGPKSTKTVEKVLFENESKIIIQETSQDIHNSTTERSKVDSSLEEEWQKLKRMKINEILEKNGKQRKCVDANKETYKRKSKQGCKVNAYTPRIKPLEDMKKTRMKVNKEKEIKDAFRTYLDSYAIIKSSYDPQQEFKDSMIAMIIANGITQRDELEELLACYLTLNCDAYHHIIVKAFQEVWSELNKVGFDPYFHF